VYLRGGRAGRVARRELRRESRRASRARGVPGDEPRPLAVDVVGAAVVHAVRRAALAVALAELAEAHRQAVGDVRVARALRRPDGDEAEPAALAGVAPALERRVGARGVELERLARRHRAGAVLALERVAHLVARRRVAHRDDLAAGVAVQVAVAARARLQLAVDLERLAARGGRAGGGALLPRGRAAVQADADRARLAEPRLERRVPPQRATIDRVAAAALSDDPCKREGVAEERERGVQVHPPTFLLRAVKVCPLVCTVAPA